MIAPSTIYFTYLFKWKKQLLPSGSLSSTASSKFTSAFRICAWYTLIFAVTERNAERTVRGLRRCVWGRWMQRCRSSRCAGRGHRRWRCTLTLSVTRRQRRRWLFHYVGTAPLKYGTDAAVSRPLSAGVRHRRLLLLLLMMMMMMMMMLIMMMLRRWRRQRRQSLDAGLPTKQRTRRRTLAVVVRNLGAFERVERVPVAVEFGVDEPKERRVVFRPRRSVETAGLLGSQDVVAVQLIHDPQEFRVLPCTPQTQVLHNSQFTPPDADVRWRDAIQPPSCVVSGGVN